MAGRGLKVLSGSVGAGGMNKREDVALVQVLLNSHRVDLLDVDGVCGKETATAIHEFQAAVIGKADGRVDPGGFTFVMLAFAYTYRLRRGVISPRCTLGGPTNLKWGTGTPFTAVSMVEDLLVSLRKGLAQLLPAAPSSGTRPSPSKPTPNAPHEPPLLHSTDVA